MARPTDWRRFQAPGATPFHDQQATLCALAPGETLTRVRLHLDVTSGNANEYVWSSIPILWGVCLVDQPAGTAPDLFTDASSEQWMWWEGISLRNQPAQGTGSAKFIDQGPDGGGDRDIKAQRKATAGVGSFVIFRMTGSPVVPTQALYLGLTASCLVILP
jgi:hypothetical protein